MMEPFEELFNDQAKTWTFESATSDKTYTVTQGKWLFCDCWGYIAHKKCKHIKKVTKLLEIT